MGAGKRNGPRLHPTVRVITWCGGDPTPSYSWTGPLPGIVGEGWVSMVDMRAAAPLARAKEADQKRRTWRGQFERAET